MHKCIENNAKDTLQLVLEHNLDFDAFNDNGNIALHNSVAASNKKAVELLLQFGANTKTKDRSGKTATERAKNSKFQELNKAASS